MSENKNLKISVFLNYTALGCIIGFVQGGIAIVLRQQGIALTSMSWVFALYLPFGMAFLWSPLHDYFKPRFSYRQQMFSAQIVACLLLTVMAIASRDSVNLPILWALALLLNIFIAALDLALDGFCSLCTNKQTMPSIAAAKVGGLSLGALIGGGILVGKFNALDWSGVFMVIAIILLVAMPFVYLLKEPAVPNKNHRGLGLSVCWREPVFRQRLWRITLFSCCLMAVFNLNRLLLVDMGLSLSSIGLYLGTATPLGSLLLALLLPIFIRRYSLAVVFLFCAILLLAIISILTVAIGNKLALVALVLAVIIGIICAGLLLVIGSVILNWAKSGQSATDYALLYGLGRLCATLLLLVLPSAIANIGWQNYYMLMIGLLLIASTLLHRLIGDK